MSKYRTAMGKTIDMALLRSKNQNVRAVGNMNVDAAGNTLDSHNQVISDSSKRVNQIYNRTTVNPGAVARGRALPNAPKVAQPQPAEADQRYVPPPHQPVQTPQPQLPITRIAPPPQPLAPTVQPVATVAEAADAPSDAELAEMDGWETEQPVKEPAIQNAAEKLEPPLPGGPKNRKKA